MMWSFNRRDDQVSPTQLLLTKPQSHSSDFRSMKSRKATTRVGRYRKQGHRHDRIGAGLSSADSRVNIEEMSVNETSNGIEVSLDIEKLRQLHTMEAREPPHTPREPVMSIKERIRQRQKVHRAQFSTSFPALKQSSSASDISLDNWRPKDHRIPLCGYSLVEVAYEDALNLLQHSHVSDEYSSVQEEIKQMDAEIKALDKDRSWLESGLQKITNSFPSTSASKVTKSNVEWDVRSMLESTTLSEKEKMKLQDSRGLCFSIHLQHAKARENLLSRCGYKAGRAKNNKRKAPGDVITLSPANCLMIYQRRRRIVSGQEKTLRIVRDEPFAVV